MLVFLKLGAKNESNLLKLGAKNGLNLLKLGAKNEPDLLKLGYKEWHEGFTTRKRFFENSVKETGVSSILLNDTPAFYLFILSF